MTAIRQLAFDLPGRRALGRDDFFVAPSNALAVAKLDNWPNWTPPKLLVTGQEGAGKSHLAAVWAERANAVVLSAEDLASIDLTDLPRHVAIEDIDRIVEDDRAQVALFHAHNWILDQGGTLLLTSRVPAARWTGGLPDLASRMAAADAVSLDPPDDALLSAVLIKLFDDRQLIVTPDLITFLVARIDRSFIAAEHVVAKLDRAALSLRRRVTRALAAKVLTETDQ